MRGVAFLCCFIGVVTAHAAPWVNVGPLNVARHSHTATLLTDGRVLIAGGVGRIVGITDSAELFDPATGSNQPTGSLNTHSIVGNQNRPLFLSLRVN